MKKSALESHVCWIICCAIMMALSVHGGRACTAEPSPGDAISESVPLAGVHPRPDLKRDLWLNLNGQWDFDFDRASAGLEQRWYLKHTWSKKITVPYVHQCPLSGVEDTEHYRRVWYRRSFVVPASFEGKRVWLHVGAADFRATVWINGREAGTYEGGYTPFAFDVTELLNPDRQAENEVVIRVYDNELDPEQPRGKQSAKGNRTRYSYTHLTGIWQTVWLEAVNAQHIDRYQGVTTIEPPVAKLTVWARTAPDGAIVKATLTDQMSGRTMGTAEGTVKAAQVPLLLSAPEAELWSDTTPNLYDLRLELLVAGQVIDTVDSYLGFRTVEARDGAFFLNGRKVWLCGALDQGYWPQSLYTHPSDAAAIEDIEYAKRLGLNHIRKHQMVPDPRFLYHCDRLGILVWGEMANAARCLTERATSIAQREWSRMIQRDFNHPCIVTWVYSNENWMHGGTDAERIDHYRRAYRQMKVWDPTRPIVDTSGYYHVESDILDIHYYEGQRRLVDTYRWAQGQLDKPSENIVFLADMPYQGQPVVVSEWLAEGFADFKTAQQQPWLRAYLTRLAQFACHPLCAGHCYIQLYDVERELNGYLHYDRSPKVDPQTEATLRAAHLEATQRDPNFDWPGFINQHCPQ